MAAEQQSELVGDLKLERLGGSVKVRQADGSGNEVFVPVEETDEFVAVIKEVAENGGK